MSARRGRGRGRGGRGGGESNQLRGLFADGIWQCDCNPRLPANYFQVKKDSGNKGKWFYTCQKPRGKQCGFWLLQENAEGREQAAVLNNSRTEPRSTAHAADNKHDLRSESMTVTSSLGSTAPEFSSPTAGTTTGTNAISPPSRFVADFDVDDDDLEWPFTTEEVSRAEREALMVTTPRKAIKTEAFTTPGRLGPLSDVEKGLPTPDTGGNESNASTSAVETLTRKRKADNDFLDLISPATTPTPTRFKDVGGGSSSDGLYTDISRALEASNVSVDSEAIAAIRRTCIRYDLQAQGISKGREISRLALQARDAKILELQHRINTLEAELETERAIVKHLRWEKDTDS